MSHNKQDPDIKQKGAALIAQFPDFKTPSDSLSKDARIEISSLLNNPESKKILYQYAQFSEAEGMLYRKPSDTSDNKHLDAKTKKHIEAVDSKDLETTREHLEAAIACFRWINFERKFPDTSPELDSLFFNTYYCSKLLTMFEKSLKKTPNSAITKLWVVFLRLKLSYVHGIKTYFPFNDISAPKTSDAKKMDNPLPLPPNTQSITKAVYISSNCNSQLPLSLITDSPELLTGDNLKFLMRACTTDKLKRFFLEDICATLELKIPSYFTPKTAEQIKREAPYAFDVLFLRGQLELKNNQPDKAIKLLLLCQYIHPNHPGVHEALGYAFYDVGLTKTNPAKLNDLKASKDFLEKALEAVRPQKPMHDFEGYKDEIVDRLVSTFVARLKDFKNIVTREIQTCIIPKYHSCPNFQSLAPTCGFPGSNIPIPPKNRSKNPVTRHFSI